MPSCIVCGRSASKSSKLENLTFHRFPSTESVREKWNNFLLENALNPEKVTKNSVVCSLQFQESCFKLYKSRRLLQQYSVPSLIVNRIKNAKVIYPETLTALPVPYEVPNSSSTVIRCNRTLVKLSGDSSICVKGVLPLDEPISTASSVVTGSSTEPSKTCKREVLLSTSNEVVESPLEAASKVAKDDTPHRIFLKRIVQRLSSEVKIKNKALKSIRQTVRRQNKKIASMKLIIDDLKKQNLIKGTIPMTRLTRVPDACRCNSYGASVVCGH